MDAVYTSLSTRAIETCELLTVALPVSYRSECDWCESHPGESKVCRGKSSMNASRSGGESADPDQLGRIPGGESWAEFFARAGERLNRVTLDNPGERVVVVTHGGIVGASFVALGEISIGKASTFMPETQNTSMTEWCHTSQGWRLVRSSMSGNTSHT